MCTASHSLYCHKQMMEKFDPFIAYDGFQHHSNDAFLTAPCLRIYICISIADNFARLPGVRIQ